MVIILYFHFNIAALKERPESNEIGVIFYENMIIYQGENTLSVLLIFLLLEHLI